MEMQENTSEKQGNQVIRNEKGQVISGTPNPNGRPKGSRNFTTDFEEAIKGIKDKDTGEQLTMEKIVRIGITKMLKGDARFEGLYKDLLDRIYGKAVQPTITEASVVIETSEEAKEKASKIISILRDEQ